MAIISKDNVRKIRFFSSIRIKFLLTYIVLLAIVLVLLNTYPLTVSRRLIFSSKQTALQNQAAMISISLEALETPTTENVAQVMGYLEVEGLTMVVVTDASGDILYNQYDPDNVGDSSILSLGINKSLEGNDMFYSAFSDGAFLSSASAPILSNSKITGVVYIYEYDENQGSILLSLQNNLEKISIAISIFAIIVSLFFSQQLTKRIRSVLDAIKFVREGEYTYRIEVSGNDELAQLSDEFNSLTNRLQITEEVRRRFVSDASHELKTPLASIRLLSDSILQNSEMDKKMVHEFVDDIGNEAERLSRTTEKLLNLSRLDNKIIAERGPVDIKTAVIGTLRILKPLADNKKIELLTDLQDDCFVIATDDDIYQIILNLAENAIKYNVPSGNVNIKLFGNEKKVVLIIEDTGIGIPEEDIPNIFDRFYRVDKARSREAGGSGLGLSIVMSTVTEHNGKIYAERREQGGMRFITTFPRYFINS